MEIIATQLLPYLTTIIGFLIVYVLNGIKAEIKDVKNTVQGLEQDLRAGITALDRRVTKIEVSCSYAKHKDTD